MSEQRRDFIKTTLAIAASGSIGQIGQAFAATGGSIELGQHQRHFKTCGVQVNECDLRELRRACEGDAKARVLHLSHSAHRAFF